MGVTKRFNSEIKRRAGSERARRILVCCNQFLVGDFHGLYEHVMRTAASELRAHSLLTQNMAETKCLNRAERLAKKGNFGVLLPSTLLNRYLQQTTMHLIN